MAEQIPCIPKLQWQRLVGLSRWQSAAWIFSVFLITAQIKNTVPCQYSQYMWHFKRSRLWSLCSFQFISTVKLLCYCLLPASQAMDSLSLLFLFFVNQLLIRHCKNPKQMTQQLFLVLFKLSSLLASLAKGEIFELAHWGLDFLVLITVF